MSTKTVATPHPNRYAVVINGETTEAFKTKRQAIACGEYSRQPFVVLSPRGAEVHISDGVKPEPKPVSPKKLLAEKIEVGMTVTGTTARNQIRKVGRIVVGKKFVTGYDESGKVFGYWPLGAKVEAH